MKKTLIAIAALAATGAFAQSTVAIDGVVDAGYVSYDMKGQKVNGVDRNLSTTSQVNFRVTQDLGGGMKANWRSETDFVVTGNSANQGATTMPAGTISSFMNGEQLLGLGGGFGRVEFGALNNAALFAHLYSQPFGTAIGSGFNVTSGSTATASVRLDNSLRYTTPNFSGITAALLLRPKQNSQTTNTNAFNANLGAQNQAAGTDFNINYNAGPLNATFVSATNDATTLPAAAAANNGTLFGLKGSYTALTGNYNMGALTVYAGLQNSKNDSLAGNVNKRAQWNLAAQYDMGANRFMANYASVKNNDNGFALGNTAAGLAQLGTAYTTGGTDGTKSTNFALGYEYALSKTTSFVARYESIKDAANLANVASAANGYLAPTSQTRTRMGVGLRMGF